MRTALPLLLLAAAACPTPAAERWGPTHPLRRIVTETLVYEATSTQGVAPFLVTLSLGTCTFTVARERHGGEAQLVLQAHAKGGVPSYPLDATITSRLREADFLMRSSDSHRLKPRYKRRALHFHDRGADYLKHKHCEAPSLCHNPKHLVALPDGSRGHCTDYADCKNPDHFVWSLRYRHRFAGRAWDMLAGLYLARGLPVEVGASSPPIRVVSNRNMWDVAIKAERDETLTVPAGTFDCVRITLDTQPANDYARAHEDEVEGPFGLHGNVVLHADKATGQIVRVRGKVKLGATFDVQVRLTQRTADYLEPR